MKRILMAGALVLLVTGLSTGIGNAASTPKAKPAKPVTQTVALKAVGGSGVTGTAVLNYVPKTKKSTIKMTVKGLKALSLHPNHIHVGRCGSNGPIKIPLTTLKANKKGVAVAKSSFSGNFLHKKWYINVHKGPTMATTAQQKVLACGNIK